MTRHRVTTAVAGCLIFLFALPAFAQSADKLAAIENYIVKSQAAWRVPGLAVAVVKDDRVVFSKGFGVREIGKPEAVDADTLFAIASNSKAFTTAALAVLVDEGKLGWDDKVTKHLPEFRLYDVYATHELTIRDLVSHRSGLRTFGGDLLWYETTYSSDEILRRIRFLKPATSFRSAYGYQNVMFLAAGKIIERASGKSWATFIQERFFQPLNMKRSTTSVRQLKTLPNVATPHNVKHGDASQTVRAIRYGNVDNVDAAASINSSISDMAEWLRLQLNRGTLNGKTLFSAKQQHEMWTPHTVIALSEQALKFNPTRHFYLYGLGWFLSDYHGRKVVSHGGGLDGMISQVALMPEERLGIVVLTNSESALASAVTNKIFDEFLNVAPRDWSAEILARTAEAKAAELEQEQTINAARVANTKPSLPLTNYTGTYTSEFYGEAAVRLENGNLVLRLVAAPSFVGDLQHWHYDTFRLTWRDTVQYPFPRGMVTFGLNNQGKPDNLKIDLPNPDFNFDELEFRR